MAVRYITCAGGERDGECGGHGWAGDLLVGRMPRGRRGARPGSCRDRPAGALRASARLRPAAIRRPGLRASHRRSPSPAAPRRRTQARRHDVGGTAGSVGVRTQATARRHRGARALMGHGSAWFAVRAATTRVGARCAGGFRARRTGPRPAGRRWGVPARGGRRPNRSWSARTGAVVRAAPPLSRSPIRYITLTYAERAAAPSPGRRASWEPGSTSCSSPPHGLTPPTGWPHDSCAAGSGGNPPVAIGPQRSISIRISDLPCSTIAARYSSQSGCSPATARK